MTESSSIKYIVALVLGTFCWATGSSFAKLADLTSTQLAAFRHGIPIITMLILLRNELKPLIKGFNKLTFFISSLTALRLLIFISALKLGNFHQVMIISYSWPILTSILGYLFYKDNKKNILVSLIGMIGIVVIFLNHETSLVNTSFIALLLALTSSLIFSFINIFFKSKLKNNSHSQILFYDNIIGAILWIPIFFFNSTPTPLIEYGYGLSYGLLTGCLGFWLFYYALKNLSSFSTSILAYSELVFAVLIGIFVFNETITTTTYFGIALILSSLLLVKLEKK